MRLQELKSRRDTHGPELRTEQLIAGDTWHWLKTLADYPPADGWALSYSFRGPSVLPAAAAVVTPGTSSYDVMVDAAKTKLLKPGTYRWAAYVELNGERYTADSGVVTVEMDLSQASAGDALSHAEQALPVIEAVLSGRITADMQQYQIAGRLVTKIPVMELYELRSKYRREIWKSRNPGRVMERIDVVFTRGY